MHALRSRLMILGILFVARAAHAHVHELRPKMSALQTTLGVPPNMAAVREAYIPLDQRFLHYVLIEDIHDNPEAQGKIAAILLYAHHHWGSRGAFVEGAFGPVGPPPFPLFTVERGELDANELLRRGLFSGGELAAALANQAPSNGQAPFTVVGIDDPDLYRRQLETTEELLAMREEALKRLSAKKRQWGTRTLQILERMVSLRMTPDDLRKYRRMPRFRTRDPLLARAIELAENFYRLTDLRSRGFVLRARRRTGNAPALLVVGGFHIALLTRVLRERHESFVVLAPEVSPCGFRAHYEECLMKSLETLHQFPSGSLYAPAVYFLRLNLDRKRHPPEGDALSKISSF